MLTAKETIVVKVCITLIVLLGVTEVLLYIGSTSYWGIGNIPWLFIMLNKWIEISFLVSVFLGVILGLGLMWKHWKTRQCQPPPWPMNISRHIS